MVSDVFRISLCDTFIYMGVSKNRGTPKWMVYNGKPCEHMDDLGGVFPPFKETPIYIRIYIYMFVGQEVPRSWFWVFGDFWNQWHPWGICRSLWKSNFTYTARTNIQGAHFRVPKPFVFVFSFGGVGGWALTYFCEKHLKMVEMWWMMKSRHMGYLLGNCNMSPFKIHLVMMFLSNAAISGWLVTCNCCYFLLKTMRADWWTYCVLKNTTKDVFLPFHSSLMLMVQKILLTSWGW